MERITISGKSFYKEDIERFLEWFVSSTPQTTKDIMDNLMSGMYAIADTGGVSELMVGNVGEVFKRIEREIDDRDHEVSILSRRVKNLEAQLEGVEDLEERMLDAERLIDRFNMSLNNDVKIEYDEDDDTW